MRCSQCLLRQNTAHSDPPGAFSATRSFYGCRMVELQAAQPADPFASYCMHARPPTARTQELPARPSTQLPTLHPLYTSNRASHVSMCRSMRRIQLITAAGAVRAEESWSVDAGTGSFVILILDPHGLLLMAHASLSVPVRSTVGGLRPHRRLRLQRRRGRAPRGRRP